MELLESVYNEVLKKTKFSVTGHINFEEELNSFYNRFADSQLFKHNHNIRFLIGSVCELVNANDWKVKSYDSLFFKSYFDFKKDVVLSFYFFILQKLGKEYSLLTDDNEILNASLVLAQSLSQDLNIRVSLGKYKNPYCKKDTRISVFDIRIPEEIFKKEIRDEIPEFRDRVQKAFLGKDLLLRDNGSRNYSKNISDNIDLKPYNIFFNELFDDDRIKESFEYLTLKIKENYSDIFLDENDNYVEKMAVSAIAISFLCLFFNVSVEYFTASAKSEIIDDKKVSRTLGGIVIGYPKRKEISRAERVIFKIVAEKITSVIAGQNLFEKSEKYRYELLLRKQIKFLSDFEKIVLHKEGGDDINHFNRDLTFRDVEIMKDFFEKNSNSEEIGLSDFKDYTFKTFKEGKKIGKGMYRTIHAGFTDTISLYAENNSLYQNIVENKLFSITINNNPEPNLNVVLFNNLINCLKQDDKVSSHNIKYYKNATFFDLIVDFKEQISLEKFVGSLTKTGDYLSKTDGWGSYIISKWVDLKICSKIQIGTTNDNDFNSIIDLEEHFEPQYENNKVFKLRMIKDLNDELDKYSKLTYRINFKSI